MRIAILSDIHGNLEAFEAVLAALSKIPTDAAVCLGDMVGYGPDPEAVVQRVRERNIPAVMGNHELALADEKVRGWFNRDAAASLDWTERQLSRGSLSYLKDLPLCRVVRGSRMVHGFPPESATRYLFQVLDQGLVRTFETMPEPLCFVGHTHFLEIVSYDGDAVTRGPIREPGAVLAPESRHIVNVGSVGQPRDEDKRAAFMVWEAEKNLLELYRVSYDASGTARKIREAGLPETHARRLI